MANTIDLIDTCIHSDDIKRHIWDFVPYYIKYKINKNLFTSLFWEYHDRYIVKGRGVRFEFDITKSIYNPKTYQSYIRHLLRNDLSFIFDKIFQNKKKNWKRLKNWEYKNFKHKNYIEVLKLQAIEYNSGNCLKILKKKS
jgi:hypothetical protein